MTSNVAGWLLKAAATLIPLLLGALVTIAWQNSHALAVLARGEELLRVDFEKTKAMLEPGRTIMLRIEANEKETTHLRELVEQRLTACK
jgi:hypothetical protein